MRLKNCCNWQHRLDAGFKARFYRLGVWIGEKPGYFILIPILISILLGTGLQRINYENDPGYIFSPTNGKAGKERERVEDLFPIDHTTAFNPSRFHRPGRYARFIITALDDGSLFRSEIWREIQELDKFVQSVHIIFDEVDYNFGSICARLGEECYPNDILDLADHMDDIEAGNLTLSYPMAVINNTKFYALPLSFGGIEVGLAGDGVGTPFCKSVKAVQLSYFVNADSPKKDERGDKWEEALLNGLDSADDRGHWKWVKVNRFTERSLPDQMNENVLSVLPYAAVTGPLMFVFAVVSCMMAGDWVKSKPWLGIVGMVTPTLGTLAAFGILSYFGVPMIGLNVAAPFLMMGIGMDDAFVIIAAWRQTSVKDPVPKRMGEAYAEAAVSITITSLTDFLSFVIGLSSPFVSIQIFSAYTAVSVLATYILHVFFFGGAMALAGYHEAENCHALLWWLKATPKSKFVSSQNPKQKSGLYKLFMSGGIDPADPDNPLDNQEHGVMAFFRDKWATYLLKPWVKALVLISFAGYLAIACWGITRIEEGMELKRIATGGGYIEQFYEAEDKYFLEFPFRIQVVVTTDQNSKYSDPNFQKKVDTLVSQFQNSEFGQGGSIYSESWLSSFLLWANSTSPPISIESETEFIENFETFSRQPPYAIFARDVKLNFEKTQILASRFIVQTVNVTNWQDRRDMVTSFRQLAKDQSDGDLMEVTVFHPVFLFVDQFLTIRSSTIQLVCIAAAVMMVVSLVFIPNPICSIWVALAVLSIEAGVLGFLAHWNINLDVLSMIYLVMSIGFSVDFSAHISYAYMSNNKAKNSAERLRSCLYSLGLPILQGAISTILGVLVLVLAPSYDYVAFFKAVFLVMVIATAHGILLLPVLLTIFGPKSANHHGDNYDDDKNGEGEKARTEELNGKREA